MSWDQELFERSTESGFDLDNWSYDPFFSSENYQEWRFSNPFSFGDGESNKALDTEEWEVLDCYKWNDITFSKRDTVYFNNRFMHHIVREANNDFNKLLNVIIQEVDLKPNVARRLTWALLESWFWQQIKPWDDIRSLLLKSWIDLSA